MNVNDLESRMLDCYFSGKAKNFFIQKITRPNRGAKTIAGSGVRFAADIRPPIY
jgi:hypothetical protein